MKKNNKESIQLFWEDKANLYMIVLVIVFALTIGFVLAKWIG